ASVCRAEFAERVHCHSQQLGPVSKAANFGFSVRPSAVADRQLDDLEILLGRAKQQIEVPEGVEVAEETAALGNLLVIPSKENLRATERVFEWLPQNRRQRDTKQLVGNRVQEAHRLVFHRIHQAGAVDELSSTLGDGGVEPWQLLRRNGEIGVENEQDVTARGGASFPNGVSFSRSISLVNQRQP